MDKEVARLGNLTYYTNLLTPTRPAKFLTSRRGMFRVAAGDHRGSDAIHPWSLQRVTTWVGMCLFLRGI